MNGRTSISLVGLGALAAVILLGWLFSQLPVSYRNSGSMLSGQETRSDFSVSGSIPALRALDDHYQRAVVMLHAKQYGYAVGELRKVLEIAPKLAEGWVNMGYALIGLQRYQEARAAFLRSLDIRPRQVNAYYGLAESQWELGERYSAIASMETFIHLSTEENNFVRKARSAVWEWREALNPQESSDATSVDRPDSTDGASAG